MLTAFGTRRAVRNDLVDDIAKRAKHLVSAEVVAQELLREPPVSHGRPNPDSIARLINDESMLKVVSKGVTFLLVSYSDAR